jgi:hypothetical protein
MKRSSATILTILLLTVPALLMASDVGKRDIFRVGQVEFADNEVVVSLEVVHDEELAAMDIPLKYSDGVTLQKVTFEGTRVEDFDAKLVNIDNDNSQVIIGLINMVYAMKEEPSLKPAVNGDYVVAKLHFTIDDPSLTEIKFEHFTTEAPSHSLAYVYNDWSGEYPVVRSIHPECDNLVARFEARTPGVALPTEFELSQNNPNPFNPTTEISFALPKDAKVNLSVFNVLGQRVTTLVDEYMTAGYQTVAWNGTDYSGNTVASGVYFYKIDADDFTATKKMLLLK